MTVTLQTLIDRSTRNMGSGIHPVVKETALEVIKKAYEEGIYVQISSGYRSFSEQNALYAKGRTKPGNVVTNARGGQSYHNFGLAVDYFLVSSDGNTALWTVNDKWRRVATIGKSLGFEWGGDWTSFVDYPHFQLTGGLSLAQLRSGRKPNLVSKVPDIKIAAKEETKVAEPYKIPDYFKQPYDDAIKYGISDGGRPGESAKRIESMLMAYNATRFTYNQMDIMLKEFTKVKDKLPLENANDWEKKLRNKDVRVNEVIFMLFAMKMREYQE